MAVCFIFIVKYNLGRAFFSAKTCIMCYEHLPVLTLIFKLSSHL